MTAAPRVLASLTLAAVLAAVAAPAGPARAQNDDVRAIARDGYVYGYPLVLMQITKQIATAATGYGQFVHMLSGPAPVFRIVVAPNGDTRYSSAWVDLSTGPQVLHVPDAGGRYFVAQVMDAWTDVIADPTPRIAGSAPADYLLAGPGWEGVSPAQLHLVRSSTNDVWILARTRARPDDGVDAITAIQKQYTIVPLMRFGEASYQPPPGVLREPNVPTGPTPPSLVAAMNGEAFFQRLAAALAKNPPRAADRPIVDRLARIGIVAGKPFDASALDGAQLPPAKAFWSLTLYSPDHYLVPNAVDRYTLRDTGLRRNADGSIDVAIQHDAPDGDRTNWLPAPSGPFVVTLRMYWPLPPGLDGTYRIPSIQPH